MQRSVASGGADVQIAAQIEWTRTWGTSPRQFSALTRQEAGSTIGASVFLTHSVPPRSLVLAKGQGVKVLDKNAKAAEAIDWVI